MNVKKRKVIGEGGQTS